MTHRYHFLINLIYFNNPEHSWEYVRLWPHCTRGPIVYPLLLARTIIGSYSNMTRFQELRWVPPTSPDHDVSLATRHV